ncbi:MAG TPA: glycosyltransferase [Ilumatobacteraceae bacterium]|nr:glycosyltransferase [Ilumatobacteraceae bacterium]
MPPTGCGTVPGDDAGVMSSATVGYYVHHHGAGHATRFGRIRDVWPSEIELTALSQIELPGGVVLPDDGTETGTDPTAGGVLHWAPVGDPRLASRAALVVDWCADEAPLGVVVDVSCEAVLLCRLAGVPTIAVRQHGDRTDAAHTSAFRASQRLLAPFPQRLESSATPDWVVAKTDYCGFISSARPDHATRDPDVTADDIVVVCGAGGGRLSADQLDTLARIARPHRLVVIGEARDDLTAPNVVITGWVDEVRPYLRASPVVVASGGNNAVADVAAAASALVVVAQDRPFDEQQHHARSLCGAGVAAVATGTDSEREWRCLLDQARERQPLLAALWDPNGAERAVSAIRTAFSMTSRLAAAAPDCETSLG